MTGVSSYCYIAGGTQSIGLNTTYNPGPTIMMGYRNILAIAFVLSIYIVGANVASWSRPKKTLIIYEYESSPFSRKVRQAVSQLDLTVEYRPCPGARYGFSDQLSARTLGSRTVPYMTDPGNSITALANIQESDAIVAYLFENFGPGESKIPGSLKGALAGRSLLGGMDVSRPYPNFKPDNIFRKPLELWGFEGGESQPVRGLLCALCLAHRVINCSKGSTNLPALKLKNGGKLPYLEDPNTGKKISGSSECRDYLLGQYTMKK